MLVLDTSFAVDVLTHALDRGASAASARCGLHQSARCINSSTNSGRPDVTQAARNSLNSNLSTAARNTRSSPLRQSAATTASATSVLAVVPVALVLECIAKLVCRQVDCKPADGIPRLISRGSHVTMLALRASIGREDESEYGIGPGRGLFILHPPPLAGPGRPRPGGTGVGVDTSGSGQARGGRSAQYFAEPAPPGNETPFRDLRQALYELPGLYRIGRRYQLPDDIRPSRLLRDARRPWRELYGTELSQDSLDDELAGAAVGLVLWAADEVEGESVAIDEENLPWLARIPLIRVALSVRLLALPSRPDVSSG